MKVLLIDDNEKLNNIIKQFLELKGYNVISTTDGKNALKYINNEKFNLYIIDIHLPNTNGLDIVKHIRSKDLNIPIIMITSSLEVENFINAFKNGANEFIKKPFHLEELEIRINNLFNKEITNIIKINEKLSFDILNQELYLNNNLVKLRKKELRLLTILLKHKNKIVSKEEIISYVWENTQRDEYPLRQLVSSLKHKVPELKNHIQSFTSKGYKIEV